MTAPSYREHGLVFPDRVALRDWLTEQGPGAEGVWLVLGKPGGPRTVSAAEALEEALCQGWIDGQMRRIDDLAYRKYFAPRRRGSSWSARNRKLVEQLIARGVVAQAGLDAVAAARADGSWDTTAAPPPSEEQGAELDELIRGHEPAYTHWSGMSPSVRRTYARLYFDAKTEQTRARRLERILDRLDQNLKPM